MKRCSPASRQPAGFGRPTPWQSDISWDRSEGARSTGRASLVRRRHCAACDRRSEQRRARPLHDVEASDAIQQRGLRWHAERGARPAQTTKPQATVPTNADTAAISQAARLRWRRRDDRRQERPPAARTCPDRCRGTCGAGFIRRLKLATLLKNPRSRRLDWARLGASPLRIPIMTVPSGRWRWPPCSRCAAPCATARSGSNTP